MAPTRKIGRSLALAGAILVKDWVPALILLLPGLLRFDLPAEEHEPPAVGVVTVKSEPRVVTREPGMYVRVLVEQGINRASIAVPQQAVQFDAAGDSEVFVVGKDNRATVQPIRTGELSDGQWTVLEGLQPGDRVIVDGFQKFAAGDSVKAVPSSDGR